MCYDNKDALSAGIIVAGWDKDNGASVYNIPLGGGLFRQPWAIGGKTARFSCAMQFLTSSFQVLVQLMCTAIVTRPTKKVGAEMRL